MVGIHRRDFPDPLNNRLRSHTGWPTCRCSVQGRTYRPSCLGRTLGKNKKKYCLKGKSKKRNVHVKHWFANERKKLDNARVHLNPKSTIIRNNAREGNNTFARDRIFKLKIPKSNSLPNQSIHSCYQPIQPWQKRSENCYLNWSSYKGYKTIFSNSRAIEGLNEIKADAVVLARVRLACLHEALAMRSGPGVAASARVLCGTSGYLVHAVTAVATGARFAGINVNLEMGKISIENGK